MARGNMGQATYDARLAVVAATHPAMAANMHLDGDEYCWPSYDDNATATRDWRGRLIDITSGYENVAKALVVQGEGQEWALTEAEASNLYAACNALGVAEQVFGGAVVALVTLSDVVQPLAAQAASSAGTIYCNLNRVNTVAAMFSTTIAEAAHLARTVEFHAEMVSKARERWHTAHAKCWGAFLWAVVGQEDWR